MDALRKAMEKVGLEKCEMWGCVGSMRRKRRLLVNSQILKTAVQRAEFAKGNARNVLRLVLQRRGQKSAGKATAQSRRLPKFISSATTKGDVGKQWKNLRTKKKLFATPFFQPF